MNQNRDQNRDQYHQNRDQNRGVIINGVIINGFNYLFICHLPFKYYSHDYN